MVNNMSFLDSIFKMENCSICNYCFLERKLIKTGTKYICKNCKSIFERINNVSEFHNQYLFDESSFDEIYKSVTTNSSLRDIEFKEEYEKQQLKLKKVKAVHFNNYIQKFMPLKYNEIILSNEKVNKLYLKDISNFKPSPITKNISDLKLDNFVVLDTETTGLNAVSDELIEIAAIKFEEGIPTECLTTLIKPKKEIPNETIKINHITPEMVIDAPDISSVIKSFYDFIDNYNIVAYNIEFDIKFLYKNGLNLFDKKRYFFDAMDVCKKYYKYSNLYNYKLDTVCKAYGITRNQSHRALEDALATGILFNDLGHKIKNE